MKNTITIVAKTFRGLCKLFPHVKKDYREFQRDAEAVRDGIWYDKGDIIRLLGKSTSGDNYYITGYREKERLGIYVIQEGDFKLIPRLKQRRNSPDINIMEGYNKR